MQINIETHVYFDNFFFCNFDLFGQQLTYYFNPFCKTVISLKRRCKCLIFKNSQNASSKIKSTHCDVGNAATQMRRRAQRVEIIFERVFLFLFTSVFTKYYFMRHPYKIQIFGGDKQSCILKFIYSEEATKFCEISINYLTGSST